MSYETAKFLAVVFLMTQQNLTAHAAVKRVNDVEHELAKASGA